MAILIKHILLLLLVSHITAPVKAQGFFKNPVRELKKGGKNFGRVLDKAVKDASKTVGVALHDIGKATGAAAENARKAIEKGLFDASKTAGKAGKDLAAETGRVGTNAVEMVKAVGKYMETNVAGSIQSLSDAEKRFREGKLLDAMFHLALDPLTTQEEAAFIATQESGWLNTAGAAAASAYGGPAGAAAYATWQTYKATGGNAELALRAGLITGLTNYAMTGIGKMAPGTTPEMLQKAVLAGSVGGLAVAASGGNEDDIKKAFILGGGMVIVQDGYRAYTGHPLNPQGASAEPYCTSATDPTCKTLRDAYEWDADGNLRLNTAKLDPNASMVGIAADPNNPQIIGKPIPLGSDQSTFMRTVAKIPGMNAMGLFHDKWVVSWNMSPLMNKMTIFPAVALTYFGTGAPLNNQIVSTVVAGNTGNIVAPTTTTTATTPPTGIITSGGTTGTTAIATPVAQSYSFLSANGEMYYVQANKVFSKYGQLITDQAILAEAVKNAPATALTAQAGTSSPYMYNFSNPNTGVSNSNEKVIPNGFNGADTSFKELPPITVAMQYDTYQPWEKYGFENMYVITHATAPGGSILHLRNIANNKMVRVYVIGKVSATDINKGITMRLSKKAVQDLGNTGAFMWVEGEYEDITIDSKNIIRNGSGISGKLVFNNLRNGKWDLMIFTDFQTVYRNKDYKNDLIINFPPGNYGFELADISTGQTYRGYTGTFNVN
jgi:hypothetical protein